VTDSLWPALTAERSAIDGGDANRSGRWRSGQPLIRATLNTFWPAEAARECAAWLSDWHWWSASLP